MLESLLVVINSNPRRNQTMFFDEPQDTPVTAPETEETGAGMEMPAEETAEGSEAQGGEEQAA